MHITHTITKPASVIDLKFLEIVSAGDRHFMKKIILIFLEKSEIRLKEMVKCMDTNKWEKVRDLAHISKSSFLSIGAKEIACLLEKMELHAKQSTRHQMQVILTQIGEANKQVSKELNTFLKHF